MKPESKNHVICLSIKFSQLTCVHRYVCSSLVTTLTSKQFNFFREKKNFNSFIFFIHFRLGSNYFFQGSLEKKKIVQKRRGFSMLFFPLPFARKKENIETGTQ